MPDWADPVADDQPVRIEDVVEETEERLEEADEETRAAEKSAPRQKR